MPRPPRTIAQLQAEYEQGLCKILKEIDPRLAKYSPRVSFVSGKRKKRVDAGAETWSPDSGAIQIRFEPALGPARVERSPVSRNEPEQRLDRPQPDSAEAAARVADLVRALDRAESRPGYDFVALKWFRDVFLPAQGFDWAASDTLRRNLLGEAIEGRIILTSKVPNPKSPQFPVTAIRLNRTLQQTQAILGRREATKWDFEPVTIPGEGLSKTILRERR
jgi:hypothetical protein